MLPFFFFQAIPIIKAANFITDNSFNHLSNDEKSISENSCGSNLTYKLEEYKLIIKGQGKMNEYSNIKLPPWHPNRTDIIIVDLPKEITSIGSHAFADCINLQIITIPENVTYIGKYAFMKCYNLQSIEIPSKVDIIPYWLFYQCIKLSSIKFLVK